ncbi:uridine kinase [Klebsiella pneumoniae]|uniref:uridine/cytidine kinase n=1 Tax=Klebsiella pneumoniae TaxID=573 RepID=A0A378G3F7_KLEPN|nr:uridine kinase [Klebsiella pneumoniae]
MTDMSPSVRHCRHRRRIGFWQKSYRQYFSIANCVNKLATNILGVIPEDSYYKDQSHLSMEERVKTNYDHPSSMDHSLLFQHLQMLKSGQPIELPVYSYVEHTRTPNTIHVEPKKVIILEGILLLTDARLRNELNFSIFVDTPLDICLMRRIKRDVNERGRSMDSVMAQYQKTRAPDVPAVY